MTFDALDAKMRVFETAHDYCVLPGMYMIARLDGSQCYWLLRKQGKSATQATAALLHLSVAQKNALLLHAGINFNGEQARYLSEKCQGWATWDAVANQPKYVSLSEWEGMDGVRLMHKSEE
jgi:tRNA(His) 5'-end guanylyltransferase